MNRAILIRPTLTYLFSYIWLIGELILFTYLSDFTANEFAWVSPLFFLLFARLYYWLNFSPETNVQSVFIVGLAGISLLSQLIEISINYYLLVTFWLMALLIVGIARNRMIQYGINKQSVSYALLRSKNLSRDISKPVKAIQHGRGKLLNFGCILIPITTTPSRSNVLFKLFFGKRNDGYYHGHIRIDGIPNHQQVVEQIKQIDDAT